MANPLMRLWRQWRQHETIAHLTGEVERWKALTYLKGLQLALLEELFREKQAKITRLQSYHTEHRRPLYEDLRKEHPIRDAEGLAQSIDRLAQRANRYRERTGQPWPHSDGTVEGVPGDRPNEPVGEAW